MKKACIITILLSVAAPIWGQRALTDIPDPDPDYQLSLMTPAEGFEISLFASDPMISNPIAMSFDAKGRLYVATSESYPQIRPGQRASDKIFRLEDTDGDGKADTRTVFAEGLLIPTAILAMPEGVYVGQSTELRLYEDLDDDGVADRDRVILSGFGTEDTHHLVHALAAGPAGRIHFNQSVYIHSYLETPSGLHSLKAGGVWRLRPETMDLDIYTRGLWNSWGHQWDEWGQSFQSDGAGYDGLSYAFPGAVFVKSDGFQRYLRGLNPGQPKLCGLEIVSGRHFPESWQGRIITCDFRGNRIISFNPVDAGSAFRTPQSEDLVTSTHGAFRPIDVKLGMDGALYVADWYNPIIQHGEVDFRDQRRDRSHGRIWRIVAKDQALVPLPHLAEASVSKLLEQLTIPEASTRQQARALLKVEGAAAVQGPLARWLAQHDGSGPEGDRARLEGLWVLQSLQIVDEALVERLLDSEDFRMRAAALRVFEEFPDKLASTSSILKRAARDPHPRVRMEALHALRSLGGAESAKVAMQMHEPSMDETFDFALWRTMRALAEDWIPAAEADELFFGDAAGRLVYAVNSAESAEALALLLEHWKKGRIDGAAREDAMLLMCERGDAAVLTLVWKDILENEPGEGSSRASVLEALLEAAENRKVIPDFEQEDLVEKIGQAGPDVRTGYVKLAGAWKAEESVTALKTIIQNSDTKKTLSDAAIDALARMDSEAAKKGLLALMDAEQPFETRLRAASGYAVADPVAAAPSVVAMMVDAKASNDVRELVRPYMAKRGLSEALARRLEGATIGEEVATTLLRMLSSAPTSLDKLETALRDAAGIVPVDASLSASQLSDLIEYAQRSGDPARGEGIYHRDALLCATCHAIGGAGGALGPDLTSIGASAPVDYIIESLLEPAKKIKEGYHVVSITTKGGAAYAGTVAREDEQTVALLDMTSQEINIAKSDIANRSMIPISLMPAGLTTSLRKDEFADLVRFLSELGKEGDYKISKVPMVRTFRYLDDKGGDKGMADTVRHNHISYMATDDPSFNWISRYANVDGRLFLDKIPFFRREGGKHFNYLRFDVKADEAGVAGLKFNDSEGLRLWMGEDEIEWTGDLAEIEFSEGVHTFTVAASRYERANRNLSISVMDTTETTTHIQIVNGK